MANQFGGFGSLGPHSGETPWFRLGRLEVNSTVLATMIFSFSMVLVAVVPGFYNSVIFAPGEALPFNPLRIFLWPLAVFPSVWSLLGLVFFWYFGSRLEEILGRVRMLRFLGWTWLVHTGVGITFGFLGSTSQPLFGGDTAFYYVVVLLLVAEFPQMRFGIPFTQISFPAWIAVVAVVAVSSLGLLARGGLITIVAMAVAWALMAVVARSMRMLAHFAFIPKLGGGASKGPQAAHPSAARGKSRGKTQRRSKRATKKQRKSRAKDSVVAGPWADELDQHLKDRGRLDQILDKINDVGMEGLSDSERKELQVLRDRLKKD